MDFIANQVFLYHVIVASETLLTIAAQQSTGFLSQYFREHLEEERDHAQWLAEDLLSVGVDVKRTLIPVEAVEMVGSIYYGIYHVDPVVLLGYMLVLEAEGCSAERLAALSAQYPQSLLRTLRHHVEHDVEHAASLQKIIESCTPAQHALIRQTAQRTREYIGRAALAQRKAG
jgi:pyrroloquinoline quinone (PQQ) biosynthesis protein C